MQMYVCVHLRGSSGIVRQSRAFVPTRRNSANMLFQESVIMNYDVQTSGFLGNSALTVHQYCTAQDLRVTSKRTQAPGTPSRSPKYHEIQYV